MSEENKTVLEEEDMNTVVTEEYSAKDIQVLEGLEAVRKRPDREGFIILFMKLWIILLMKHLQGYVHILNVIFYPIILFLFVITDVVFRQALMKKQDFLQ